MSGEPPIPQPATDGAAAVCAWCKVVLQEGSIPVSHGICDRCLAERLPPPTPPGQKPPGVA